MPFLVLPVMGLVIQELLSTSQEYMNIVLETDRLPEDKDSCRLSGEEGYLGLEQEMAV